MVKFFDWDELSLFEVRLNRIEESRFPVRNEGPGSAASSLDVVYGLIKKADPTLVGAEIARGNIVAEGSND